MTLRFRSSDLRHLFDALLAPPARANSGSCCSGNIPKAKTRVTADAKA